MVMEGWEYNGPELLEESVVLVGVDEVVELEVDASQAGLDPGGLPLDEGVEDVLALGMVELEEAGSGVLWDEVEGL